MPTAEQLKQVYAFISVFEGDPILQQHGDNALPLYAVAFLS
jgi:hypothetical protein